MYLQRNGHVVMVELINDGSREITDVELKVDFVDSTQTVIGDINLSIKSIASHTSISGDDMELSTRLFGLGRIYDSNHDKMDRLQGVENEEIHPQSF